MIDLCQTIYTTKFILQNVTQKTPFKLFKTLQHLFIYILFLPVAQKDLANVIAKLQIKNVKT